MSINRNYVEYRLLTFGIAVFVVLSVISFARGCEMDEPTWPESDEFEHIETGAERFSWHDTGGFGWKVIVDHQTGVQYLACMEYRYGAAVCPLLDADGSPLLVAEAGE